MASVIVYARRTPIGKFCGALSQMSAPKMGALLVKDLLSSLSLSPDAVDEIIMGQVLTAGVGQAPARQTALLGGLSKNTPALTIQKVCGSGLKAVMLADDLIKLGRNRVVICGGQENMSLAPHMLEKSRFGYKFGTLEVKDHMQIDGLWDPYNQVPMGHCGELCAEEFGFTRESQDEFATESYKRSQKAWKDGLFAAEVLAVPLESKGVVKSFDQDEEPFSVDLNKLLSLKAAFKTNGTITAGNASSINDGAAVVCIMEEAYAREHGYPILAKITYQNTVATEPLKFSNAPILGIQKLLKDLGKSVGDFDLFEINEAFSVVPMAAMKVLGIPKEKINLQGGAVSIGHPIGASGARLVATVVHQLHQRNLKKGVASLCIGGGEACTVVIERV